MRLLRLLPPLLVAFVVLIPASSEGAPQNNILVSQDSLDTNFADASGAYSYAPSVSSDGNYVAFQSLTADRRDGDRNTVEDVFRRDVAQSATVLVSLSNDGRQGNNRSYAPDMTADGATVVFESLASNLVPGDNNNTSDIFLRDLTAQTTTRISIASDGGDSNGASFRPAISSDGAFIAFCSRATNLVPGGGTQAASAFLFERATGKITRIPIDAPAGPTSGCQRVAIDSNGGVVAVASLSGELSNVYTYDRASGTAAQLIPTADGSSGISGLAISGDGQAVAFDSTATNLVLQDTNRSRDVFVETLGDRKTTRVSVRSDGSQLPADSGMSGVAISGDGRFVVFGSVANEVVPGDSNGREDVFRHELASGQTTIVSVTPDGQPANDSSYAPDINADGSAVAFASLATNIIAGDANRQQDVFERNTNFPDRDGESAPEDTGARSDDTTVLPVSDGGNTHTLEYAAGGIAAAVIALAASWILLGRRGRA
jgi:Tol biopolymer transport system component